MVVECLQWGAMDTEIKVPYIENAELKVKDSPIKAWSRSVCSHTEHATLTDKDFFLANFYPSSSFTCIFSKISSANTGSCVGPQNKIGHLA